MLAAGGGIVSQTETYDLLLSRCLTIWLRASPEEHMQRVSAQGLDGQQILSDVRALKAKHEKGSREKGK